MYNQYNGEQWAVEVHFWNAKPQTVKCRNEADAKEAAKELNKSPLVASATPSN